MSGMDPQMPPTAPGEGQEHGEPAANPAPIEQAVTETPPADSNPAANPEIGDPPNAPHDTHPPSAPHDTTMSSPHGVPQSR